MVSADAGAGSETFAGPGSGLVPQSVSQTHKGARGSAWSGKVLTSTSISPSAAFSFSTCFSMGLPRHLRSDGSRPDHFGVHKEHVLSCVRTGPVLNQDRACAGVKTIISFVFTGFVSRKLLCFFVRETLRLFAWRAPGLFGNLHVRALKLIVDTEHCVGTGPAPYRIDSVSRCSGRYLET